MNAISTWIMGGVTAALAVVGRYVASHADDEAAYYGGLIFFMFAVALVLLQIKRASDRRERELNNG